MTKTPVIEKLKNTPADVMAVFISTCVAILGFNIAIAGALLNGLAIFDNAKDLHEGFSLILIGISIIAFGIMGICAVFFINECSNYSKLEL